MRFKRHLKFEHGLMQIDIAPFINVVFLLFIFFMLSTSFTFQSGINVKLPKAVTSDTIKQGNLIITITSEDVLYLNNKIITLQELAKEFKDPKYKRFPLMIKSDRRSSMGRIVDVWDLCRNLGLEKINIATNQE